MTQFLSDDRVEMADDTPVKVFTDGMFYILTDNKNLIVTGGQPPTQNPLIPYSLKDLEFPVTARHDIEDMFIRMNLLC